jgi:hypothetical protein
MVRNAPVRSGLIGFEKRKSSVRCFAAASRTNETSPRDPAGQVSATAGELALCRELAGFQDQCRHGYGGDNIASIMGADCSPCCTQDLGVAFLAEYLNDLARQGLLYLQHRPNEVVQRGHKIHLEHSHEGSVRGDLCQFLTMRARRRQDETRHQVRSTRR